MKEHIDIMDKAIKEKFEGHEVSVPSSLWNSIESNLPPEKETGGGNLFFKNPFTFSILVITTVIIGAYIYNTQDTQNNKTTAAVNTTATTDLSGDVSKYSPENTTNTVDTISEKENNQTPSSSSIHTENTYASVISKNQRGNTTGVNKNSENTSSASANNTQSKIDYLNKKNQSVSNKKNMHTAATTSNSYVANHSTKIQTTTPSSIEQSLKSTNNQYSNSSNQFNNHSTKKVSPTSSSTDRILDSNNNVHLSTSTSNHSGKTSGLADSTSTSDVDNTTAASGYSTAQPLSENDSENKISRTIHVDSIKQVTPAFIDKDYTSNNDDTISNDPINKNSSTNNTEITNSNSTVSDQALNLTASHVTDTTLVLNPVNSIHVSSEMRSLNTNKSRVNKVDTSASIDQALAPNANISETATNKTAFDSSNNKINLENLEYSNINNNNENNIADSKNSAVNQTVLKNDSTIIDQKADSSTVESLAQPINKTTNDNTKKKSSFLSRCSFDGYATPALGYLHVSSNNNQEDTTNIVQRNKNTKPGFGYTTGLRMNYALTQKIEIGIGLQYSSLSQQSYFTQQHIDSTYNTYQGHTQIDSTYDSISHKTTYSSHYVITGTTSVTAFSNQVKKYTNKFQNISIPIYIAYGYSISNKLSLIARTSLLINYQIYSVTYINEADGTIVGHHSNKNISLGGSFSIGGYYQFSKACSVFAEPIISYYFSSVFDKQASFKQTQFMLGLQTGIRLSF